MSELLEPLNPWMFSRLFGVEERKNLTISLLNALFDGTRSEIVDIDFIPLELGASVTRSTLVDVWCKCANGDIFLTEIQPDENDSCFERLMTYAEQVYLNQKGKNVKETISVVSIVSSTIHGKDKDYLSHDVLVKLDTNEQRLKHFSFTFLELSKFKKTAEQLENNIDKWAYFFKEAGGSSLEEMRMPLMLIPFLMKPLAP